VAFVFAGNRHVESTLAHVGLESVVDTPALTRRKRNEPVALVSTFVMPSSYQESVA
jgi:hypothetical protein